MSALLHLLLPLLLLCLCPQEIMCDPWVTDEGRAPLRSCADLGLGSIEVTTQEQAVAIDRASVVSMIRARLKEKVFRSNEYLFQAVSVLTAVHEAGLTWRRLSRLWWDLVCDVDGFVWELVRQICRTHVPGMPGCACEAS